jgi:hypothetical protein
VPSVLADSVRTLCPLSTRWSRSMGFCLLRACSVLARTRRYGPARPGIPVISGFGTRAGRKAAGQTLRVVWARHRAAGQPDGGPPRGRHCLLQRVMVILRRVFSVRSGAGGEARLERTWHYPSANRARLQFAAASFRNCSDSGLGRKGRQPPLSSPLENPGE